jgi:hypothetical protein
MVARKDRGKGIKQIARELGVDRKTVKRWLRVGVWRPRQVQRRFHFPAGRDYVASVISHSGKSRQPPHF